MASHVSGMRRAVCCWALGIFVFGAGCTDSHSGRNGQTHWLRQCNDKADCAGLSCICGLCSAACTDADACKETVGEAAVCQAAATVADPAECLPRAAKTKVCVAECSKDAECTKRDSHLRCVEGVCSAGRVGTGNADAATATGDDGGADDAGGATVGDSSTAGDSGSGSGDSGLVDASDNAPDNTDDDTDDDPDDDAGGVTRTYAANELECTDGVPSHLPDNVALIESDIDEYAWTVSKHIYTHAEFREVDFHSPYATFRRRSLLDSSDTSVTDELPNSLGSFIADGADTVAATHDDVGNTIITVLPGEDTPFNIALKSGGGGGSLAMDPLSLYWMGVDTNILTLWRSPRTPGESTSLGTLSISSTMDEVQGLVTAGDWIFTALNTGGHGQVMRASKDGTTPLAAFGPLYMTISGLTTDGTDLFVMAEGENDSLGNPVVPPRILRMTSAGTTETVASLKHAGDYLAFSGAKIYWRENANVTDHVKWSATVWSVDADGSSEPKKTVVTTGNLLSANLISDEGDIYFAVYCQIVVPGGSGGRTHLLRLRP